MYTIHSEDVFLPLSDNAYPVYSTSLQNSNLAWGTWWPLSAKATSKAFLSFTQFSLFELAISKSTACWVCTGLIGNGILRMSVTKIFENVVVDPANPCGNAVHVICCPSQVKANMYWESLCTGALKKAAYKSITEKYFTSAGYYEAITVNGSETTGWGITTYLLIALRSCTNLKTSFPSESGLDFFTDNIGALQRDSQGVKVSFFRNSSVISSIPSSLLWQQVLLYGGRFPSLGFQFNWGYWVIVPPPASSMPTKISVHLSAPEGFCLFSTVLQTSLLEHFSCGKV